MIETLCTFTYASFVSGKATSTFSLVAVFFELGLEFEILVLSFFSNPERKAE